MPIMRAALAAPLSRCMLAAVGLHWSAAACAQVDVEAPAPLDEFLERHLQAPDREARETALEAFRRDVRRTVAELLATEGYFSPDIEVRADPGTLAVTVAPGARTTVAEVSVEFRGPIAAQRRDKLLAAWPLREGEPFRDTAWNEAKQTLLRQLLAVDFPAARLVDSRAEIDPATAQARLHAVYDTGPHFVFGELQVSGLSRYSPALIRRYSGIEPGAPYDEGELLALQGALQRTPYFSAVSVEIARPEPLPEPLPERGPVRAAVEVHVQEAPPHRLSFGVGVSTNTGAQVEALYEGIDFLDSAWQLNAGARLEQLRQRVFADVHLPPQGGVRYSFGGLLDHEDIQRLERRRVALGAVRTQMHGPVEARYALNWQRELRDPADAPSTASKALTLDGTWTLRRVDDLLDPRQGFVLQLQAGGGTKALLSDQNFLRLRLQDQHFFPIAERDVFSLRGELGITLAPSRDGIPQDFLFRAGGTQSVRGYEYQSLGVREGDAVVGGRYLVVGSAEYTHWFNARWGAAAFIDAGDAADDRNSLDPAVGYGIGARWKSPAGPLAVDLAYGQREHQFRLHLSLAIAF